MVHWPRNIKRIERTLALLEKTVGGVCICGKPLDERPFFVLWCSNCLDEFDGNHNNNSDIALAEFVAKKRKEASMSSLEWPSSRKVERLEDMQASMKEWSDYNFPNNTWEEPAIGMVEELGELAHVILKTRQGIYKYQEPSEKCPGLTKADCLAQDAIADIVIYGVDFANRRGLEISWPATPNFDPSPELATLRFGNICIFTGLLWEACLEGYESNLKLAFKELIVTTFAYSRCRGWDFTQIVLDTWNDVRQRDWKLNPVTGGKPVGP